jgi:F-type H+-transporting ATPase subunit delta
VTSGLETRANAMDDVLDAARARARAAGEKGLLGKVIDAVRGEPSAADPDTLASDLFGVVDALDSSVALRRAMTDPSTPEESRRNLVHGLFGGKVSPTAVAVVAEGAAMRWPGGRSFAEALERQAVRAQLAAADEAGNLGEAEDELFRFARTVESSPELRNTLANRGATVAQRQELVEELLHGRATEATVVLAQRAVTARERTFAHTIEGFVTLAAAQRNRVVATVRVATALTAEQRTRLQASLSRQAGREVAVQEVIDPSVVGGVRVELGDEVVEGTVAARLLAARRLFD